MDSGIVSAISATEWVMLALLGLWVLGMIVAGLWLMEALNGMKPWRRWLREQHPGYKEATSLIDQRARWVLGFYFGGFVLVWVGTWLASRVLG